MSSAVLVNIFRFIMLLAIQIVIFNNMNFLGYISPFPYILYIILYPVNSNKAGLIISLMAALSDISSVIARDKTRGFILVRKK